MFKQRIWNHASSPWEGENTTLQADLIEAAESWSELAVPTMDETLPPCPISYPQDEVAQCLLQQEKVKETEEQIEDLRMKLGVGVEGWVPKERYEESQAINSKMKVYALEFAESPLERQMLELLWPFDDRDEHN